MNAEELEAFESRLKKAKEETDQLVTDILDVSGQISEHVCAKKGGVRLIGDCISSVNDHERDIVIESYAGVLYRGEIYRVNDTVYVSSGSGSKKKRDKRRVIRIDAINTETGNTEENDIGFIGSLFYSPKDAVKSDMTHWKNAPPHELFISDVKVRYPVTDLQGPCIVKYVKANNVPLICTTSDVFFCRYKYVPSEKNIHNIDTKY